MKQFKDLSELIRKPLPRREVIKAIERKYPVGIPLIMAKWWGEGLEEQYGDRLKEFDIYPEDVQLILFDPLDYARMPLPWLTALDGAHDSRRLLDDWGRLDEFIASFPDPESDPQFDAISAQVERVRRVDGYLLIGWWRLFFERPWGIRGLTNMLMDFKMEPEKVHRLQSALCELYLSYLRRLVREFQPDGFWTSDDLGHQRSLFMRPETFRELIKPYYLQIGEYLRQNHVHWWLHSCGDNTAVLADLIEAGVNVFHPVQKGAMDEVAVAQEFGDRMVFLVGIDVQHILQEGTPGDVRTEVRRLVDLFDRPEGGMGIAAGNGILPGTPFENIHAFLEEALVYGTRHRLELNSKRSWGDGEQ